MLVGPEAQLTRRGIHFQVAGGGLGWLVAGCARHVGREVVSYLPCLLFGGLALAPALALALFGYFVTNSRSEAWHQSR